MLPKLSGDLPERGPVLVVGQLPPPTTGFAYATRAFADIWADDRPTTVVDIAARRGAAGWRKHVSRLLATWRACRAVIARRGHYGQVCYIACEGGLGLVYTLQLVLAARLAGLHTFLHHHSFAYIDRPRSLMRAVLAAQPRLHHVFLCCTMRDAFERGYDRKVISTVLSNAALVMPDERGRDTPAGPLVLGHLSNLTREKGLYIFIDLLRAALATGQDVRGILAGPIADPADRDAVSGAVAELCGRLDYRGPLFGEDKDDFYREVDVFAFPTQYANEAQPIVLFEAMAAGCKIIAYQRGCIAEQLGGDGLGISRDQDFVAPAVAWLAASRDVCLADRAATTERYAAQHATSLTKARLLFEGAR